MAVNVQSASELHDIFIQYKLNTKLQDHIIQNLAEGEMPLAYGKFYSKSISFTSISIILIIAANSMQFLFRSLGINEDYGFIVAVPILIMLFLWVFNARTGILVTNFRLLLIPLLNKNRTREIVIQSISKATLKSSVLKLEYGGKKESFQMDNYSSMFWKDSRRKQFINAIQQQISL